MTMESQYPVLIVDDEHDFRSLLVEALESMGYAADGADNAENAIQMVQHKHYAIVFTDLNMPGGQSGLDLLKSIQSHDPRTFTILMTGFATTESAIQALKRGAYDFIQKPFKLAEMEASLVRALNHYKSLRENEAYKRHLEEMVRARTKEIEGLNQDIERLFEGFVKASITAIEARDPSTWGHSSRVADLTVALAEVVDRASEGPYADAHFSSEQIKELRYACLLHDFGKVGVREQVLTKAKKLPTERMERILQRLFQKDLERNFQILNEALSTGAQSFDPSLFEKDQEERKLERTKVMDLVLRCNEPQLLSKEIADGMDHLEDLEFTHFSGLTTRIIEPEDIAALRIPRGSLSLEEREEINSHVVHSYQFLKQIPWTESLAHIPEIVYTHHERLNGKGYPRNLVSDQIPLQAKIMAVTDIYDSLVACDRPYKVAVSIPRSLEILKDEAKAGLLDSNLVDFFIESKVYELTLDRLRV